MLRQGLGAMHVTVVVGGLVVLAGSAAADFGGEFCIYSDVFCEGLLSCTQAVTEECGSLPDLVPGVSVYYLAAMPTLPDLTVKTGLFIDPYCTQPITDMMDVPMDECYTPQLPMELPLSVRIRVNDLPLFLLDPLTTSTENPPKSPSKNESETASQSTSHTSTESDDTGSAQTTSEEAHPTPTTEWAAATQTTGNFAQTGGPPGTLTHDTAPESEVSIVGNREPNTTEGGPETQEEDFGWGFIIILVCSCVFVAFLAGTGGFLLGRSSTSAHKAVLRIPESGGKE